MSNQNKISIDLLKEAGIPKKFRYLDLNTYVGSDEALEQCKYFTKNFDKAYRMGSGLLLVGPSLTFKTFLACLVLKSLMVRGFTVKYCTFPQLTSFYENKILGMLFGEDIDCVVIDDVGPKTSFNSSHALHQFVTTRSDSGLPYIICSEFTEQRQWEAEYSSKLRKRMMADLIEVVCGDQEVVMRSQALNDSRKESIVHRYHVKRKH